MCPEQWTAPNLAAWLSLFLSLTQQQQTRGSSLGWRESLVGVPQLKSAPLPKNKREEGEGEHQRQIEMCS